MDELRRPFFFLALVLIAIVVLLEVGSSLAISASSSAGDTAALARDFARSLCNDQGICIDPSDAAKEAREAAAGTDAPPGLAIPSMALVDAAILFTVALMGLSLILPSSVHGRLQGLATLIVCVLILLAALALLIGAITLLLLMVSLFLAAPFGTLAYLAIYGSFPVGSANAILAYLLMLKLGFAVCLVLAHPRFLQNRGLVLIIATSLLLNLVIGLLHGFVPVILVSITDAIGAILVAVLALIWAIAFLVGSLSSILKALRFDRAT